MGFRLLGVRIRGTLEDIEPLNKVPFQRAISIVKKGPLSGLSLILPRKKPVAKGRGFRGSGFK